jgi:sugar phosphate permease
MSNLQDMDYRSLRDSHRWLVFGVISSVYFFVYFHRVSTSVIATDLLEVFQTHATALGFMSSMYFYVYALEQPLVGYLSDVLGPRRVVGMWSMVSTLGCIIFGLAPNIVWASVGRGLIGFGVGAVYVPALKAFSQWFKEKEFATMTGLLISVGNLGAIVATTPLAWMVDIWGWRLTFFVIGGVTLGLAFATLLMLRDHPEMERGVSSETSLGDGKTKNTGNPTRQLLSSLRFWVLAVIFCGVFGTFLTYQGLWATPSLMSTLDLDRLKASQLNMLLPIGMIIGAPFIGWLVDRVFKNKLVVFNSLLATLTSIWFLVALGGETMGWEFLIPLLFFMGIMSGGFASTLWAIARETTQSHIFGLMSGLLNPAPFLGVAILQPVTGAILDRIGRVDGIYPPAAFRDAFLLCALITLGCFILSLIFRNTLARANNGR